MRPIRWRSRSIGSTERSLTVIVQAKLFNPYLGRRVRGLLEDAGLTEIDNEGVSRIVRGGEAEARIELHDSAGIRGARYPVASRVRRSPIMPSSTRASASSRGRHLRHGGSAPANETVHKSYPSNFSLSRSTHEHQVIGGRTRSIRGQT